MSSWINIQDKLPAYRDLRNEHVLVLFDDGSISSVHYDECIENPDEIFGEWEARYDEKTLGYLDSRWIPYKGITHWMPMPEMPEEEDPIKPCPFCGEDASYKKVMGSRWIIGCNTEGCFGCVSKVAMNFADRISAIRAWNRRSDSE